MAEEPGVQVVSKEDAVFWMDGNGRWHNADGPFRHHKISAYFHSAIQKDADGYHLYQEHGDGRAEKVYFRYEETPLFVFGVTFDTDGGIRLRLNTALELPLDPEMLFVKDDNLYLINDSHTIKFTDRSLMKLSKRLEMTEDRYRIRVHNRIHEIPVRP